MFLPIINKTIQNKAHREGRFAYSCHLVETNIWFLHLSYIIFYQSIIITRKCSVIPSLNIHYLLYNLHQLKSKHKLSMGNKEKGSEMIELFTLVFASKTNVYKKNKRWRESHHLFVIKTRHSQYCIYVEYQMDIMFWNLFITKERQ